MDVLAPESQQRGHRRSSAGRLDYLECAQTNHAEPDYEALDWHGYTYADSNAYSHCNAYTYTNSNGNTDAYTNGNTDANGNPYAHTVGYAFADAGDFLLGCPIQGCRYQHCG
ncbi:hypothetical protein D3C75_663210 [compost metagenome]